MGSFQASIDKKLLLKPCEQDELLADKVPGKMDRTTQRSYLKLAIGYLPDALQPIAKSFPELLDEKKENLLIGPIPKGTPVGLLANLNPLPDSKDPPLLLEHDKKLLDLLIKTPTDLHNFPPAPPTDNA